ncbi:MAG TPA: 2-phospho-L-lactate guanylyltransferase [Ktedonobacterales bacterium]|jgi:2-phospho-L-lactate guanylyltransferase
MTTWAIVPAKTLEQAKTRLAHVLSPNERRALSLAMLRDVLIALRGAHTLDRIAVVTADAALGAEASALGAEVLPELSTGQNAALEAGSAYSRAQGADAVLVVSADLPLLCSTTVEQLIARGMRARQSPLALLAPAHDTTGTNALFQRPPGAIPFLFGPNSLQRHQQAAAERGVRVDLVHAPGLAFDIDTPSDLVHLARSRGQTHTHQAIAPMRLLERLSETVSRTPVP